MDLSLRTIAASCVSLSPPFSVVRDFYGYIFGPPGRDMSLKRQLQLVQGDCIDINPIFVGWENFTAAERIKCQFAIQFARDIYDDVDFGIRRLNWRAILVADAGTHVTIASSAEANDLTDDWNGPADALDVFMVRVMTGADGWSAVNGPCAKDHLTDMTGSVVSLNGSNSNTGNTFAHEMGHYLGLDHVADPNNFIGNNGSSNSNTAITSAQGTTMKQHCYVDDFC